LTPREKFGPEFQKSDSRLYRAEYAVVSLAIIAYLIWRAFFAGGLDVIQTIFWVLFPDLIAFIPMAFSPRRRKWPTWGVYLYDAVHNVIAWGIAFSAIWLIARSPDWALFGWLGHITIDRSLGYGLRVLPKRS
jgi:hypothetical protein